VKFSDRRLTPPERRRFVALGVRGDKSNRAIAKELGVDEGTVRRDRKYLATPAEERPIKPALRIRLRKVRPAFNPGDSASRGLHFRRMTRVVRLWIVEEHMILPDVEHVLDEAGNRLFYSRESLKKLLVPTRSPTELLLLTRPADPVEDDMPPKLEFHADWLARWIACCLPREEALQDQLLRETSMWARSS
jgi:transposase-like protein